MASYVTNSTMKGSRGLSDLGVHFMKQLRNHYFAILIMFVSIMGFIGGYFLGFQKINDKNLKVESEFKKVNYNSYGENRLWESFQISFPSKYFVVNGNMLIDYQSIGGMAPPILQFTAGDQLLPPVQLGFSTDCIKIWSGTSTFDQWNQSIFNKPVETRSESTFTYNNHKFDKRIVVDVVTGESHIQVRFVPTNTSGYLFQTCNMNSEKDLDLILQNFHLLADSPPEG